MSEPRNISYLTQYQTILFNEKLSLGSLKGMRDMWGEVELWLQS